MNKEEETDSIPALSTSSNEVIADVVTRWRCYSLISDQQGLITARAHFHH